MAGFALEGRDIEVIEVRRTASSSHLDRADWTGLAGVCSQSVAGRTARVAEGAETGRRIEPLIRERTAARPGVTWRAREYRSIVSTAQALGASRSNTSSTVGMADCAGVQCSCLIVIPISASDARGTVYTGVAIGDAVLANRDRDSHVNVEADRTATDIEGVLGGSRGAGARASTSSWVACGGAETSITPSESLVHPKPCRADALVDVVDACCRRGDQSVGNGTCQTQVRLVLEACASRA